MGNEPNKELRFSTVVNLYNLITKCKGKGTTGLAKVKRVRKLLEKGTLVGGKPAYFKDAEERAGFGLDPSKPAYLCPECEKGSIAFNDDGSLIPCQFRQAVDAEPCGFNGPYEPDEDDIVGYLSLKAKHRKRVYVPIRDKHISAVIWPDVLLPILEREHEVAEEDMVEVICRDLGNGLPEQFDSVTGANDPDPLLEEEEKKEETETKAEPKLVEEPDELKPKMPEEGAAKALAEEAKG